MPDIDRGYIEQKWLQLQPRFQTEWQRMKLVEAWASQNESYLRRHIWSGVPKQDWGKITVVKNTIAAVSNSVVGLAIAAQPQVKVRMRNRVSPPARKQAKFNERVAKAMIAEINRNRAVPVEWEVFDLVINRGACVVKHGFLTATERGERRLPISADTASELPENEVILDEESGEASIIEEEGDFPEYVEVIDPLDCVYVLGAGNNDLRCLIHRYDAEADDILATYPDADRKIKALKEGRSPYSGSTSIQVYDYWDTEIHAILIDGEFYHPPTAHNLRRLPFEVARVAEKSLRLTREIQAISQSSTSNRASMVKAVTPFTWPMVEDLTKASFAESLLASKLPEMANTPIIHQGVSSGNAGIPASPYFQKVKYSDGRVSKVPVYRFRGDKSAGGRPLWPAFDGENFYPLNPTPIADHLQVFAQQRNFDLELTGMNADLLTGRVRSDVAGVSVNQQIQFSSVRVNPYIQAATRLLGRVLTGAFHDLAGNWDRGNVPMVLAALTDEEDVELTRELVGDVAEVMYTIPQLFPRDEQARAQMAFQANAQGAMSRLELIEALPFSDDPETTLERIAWEMLVFSDPTSPYFQAVVDNYHRKAGYADLGPSPTAQAQAAAGPAPALPQQPAAPAGPAQAGPQVPPEIAALLAAAGPPQGGEQ